MVNGPQAGKALQVLTPGFVKYERPMVVELFAEQPNKPAKAGTHVDFVVLVSGYM